MGSSGRVYAAEAAEILGVGLRTIQRMTQAKRLRIAEYEDKKALYDEEEVHALAEARTLDQTPAGLLETVQQAWAAARVAQRRVETLERLLGLNVPPAVSLDREGVLALHAEAEATLEKVINSEQKVNYWADRFFAICDAYLTRVTEVVGIKDPWRVYLELSEKLLLNQDFENIQYEPGEIIAYKRLYSSREHLRKAVFTYLLQNYGQQKAFKVFPTEFDGYHHDVMLHALASADM